jgi:hypothetical protein
VGHVFRLSNRLSLRLHNSARAGNANATEPQMIPDARLYAVAMKWILLCLVPGMFLYLFLVSHIEARVEQHWLDRIHRGTVRNRSKRNRPSTGKHDDRFEPADD